MACFDPKITETIITSIAKQHPQYFVMADRSLASDNVADNFEQLFEEYSPTTIRKIL
jgi:adenine-specific DNA-methyltransferase